MTPEDRLTRFLRGDADGYQPAPDGLDHIHRRVRSRRRARNFRRAGLPLVVLAVTAAVVVPLTSGGGTPGQVVTVGGGGQPEDLLVARPGGSFQLVSPSDGSVLRTVRPDVGDVQVTWLSVSPDGTTAYANINPRRTPACWEPQVTTIDLATGSLTERGAGASPVLDGTGSQLATYLEKGCPPQVVARLLVVQPPVPGPYQESSNWVLPASTPTAGNVVGVKSISWAPDGRHVAIVVVGSKANTVLIGDTTNPPRGQATYSPSGTTLPIFEIPADTAAYEANGDLAVVRTCQAGLHCDVPSGLYVLPAGWSASDSRGDPVGHQSAAALPIAVDQVLAAPHGGGLAYLAGGDLYVDTGAGHAVKRLLAGVTAASWAVPAPTPPVSPTSTTLTSTTVTSTTAASGSGATWSSRTVSTKGTPASLVVGGNAVYGLIPTEQPAAGGGQEASGIAVRLDPALGTVTYGSALPGAGNLAYADGWLWVLGIGAPAADKTDRAVVYRLDPTTLTVTHQVGLPTVDAYQSLVGTAGLAAAPGGVLWVGVGEDLYRIDTSTSTATGPIRTDDSLTSISTDPAGELLYTAGMGTTSQGPPLVVTERDASTGRLLAQASKFPAVAGGSVDATLGGVWVSFRTGMAGDAVRLRSSDLAQTFPSGSGSGAPYFAMQGVDVGVSGDTLLLSNRLFLACADPATGAVRAQETTTDGGSVTGSGGTIYDAVINGIAVVSPPSVCWSPTP